MHFNTILLTALAVATAGLGVYLTLQNTPKSYKKQFAEFRLNYGKLYASKSEGEYRLNVFKNNMKYIKSRPKSTFTMGVN